MPIHKGYHYVDGPFCLVTGRIQDDHNRSKLISAYIDTNDRSQAGIIFREDAHPDERPDIIRISRTKLERIYYLETGPKPMHLITMPSPHHPAKQWALIGLEVWKLFLRDFPEYSAVEVPTHDSPNPTNLIELISIHNF